MSVGLKVALILGVCLAVMGFSVAFTWWALPHSAAWFIYGFQSGLSVALWGMADEHGKTETRA